MKTSCYVTGKEGTGAYSFGEAVTLDLTQEVFAHFVLRAGRDPAHQKIMDKLKTNYERSTNLLDHIYEADDAHNVDRVVDLQLEAGALIAEKINLLIEKANSGIRILRQMRAEFKSEGRLNT